MTNLEVGHRQEGKYILAPVSDITTPKVGRICYGPSWWAVTSDNEVMFFKTYGSPQCTINRSIVERLCKRNGAPISESKFLEVAFLPHTCSDYA
jgi:hypothetical protein